MKKIFYITLFIIIIFCSCSQSENDQGAESIIYNNDQAYVMNFRQGMFPISSYNGSIDLKIANNYPDNEYENETSLYISRVIGIYNRSLIKFKIQGYLPVDIKIKKAYLSLYCFNSSNVNLELYELTRDWYPGETTWNCYNDMLNLNWDNPGSDYNINSKIIKTMTDDNDDEFISIELPMNYIENWMRSGVDNFGLLLKIEDNNSNSVLEFASTEYIFIHYRPMLTVYYSY